MGVDRSMSQSVCYQTFRLEKTLERVPSITLERFSVCRPPNGAAAPSLKEPPQITQALSRHDI